MATGKRKCAECSTWSTHCLTEGLLFCCKNCKDVFLERFVDDRMRIEREDLRDQYEIELEERLRIRIHELTDEQRTEIEQSIEKNRLEAFQEGFNSSRYCPRCSMPATSVHHIIPRAKGGHGDVANIIFLCRQCHDRVELMTDELLKTIEPHVDALRRMIILGFPREIEDVYAQVITRYES